MYTSYNGRYGVVGPPGTGKTTFLARQVREIVDRSATRPEGGSPVLVSSLTRAAAAEIGGRDLPIPAEAVGTLHAHAFRALDRPTIATGENVADWNATHGQWGLSEGASRSDDLETVDDVGGPANTEGDRLKEAYDLVRHRLTPTDLWQSPGYKIGDVTSDELVRFADAWEEWKTSSGTMDFTDLISAGMSVEAPFDPDVLVVDEVQDLSALEWELVKAWSHKRALIAVGDPWQSLYEWRGAHPELFDSIDPERLKILSKSYRVPRKIVLAALEWMRGKSNIRRDISYEPRSGPNGPVEGDICFRHDITPSNPDRIIAEAEEKARSGRTVMIAATCSYMLGGVLGRLRSLGIPYANPWRVKRGDWNPISTRGTTAFGRMLSFLSPATRPGLWTWSEAEDWITKIGTKGTLRHGAKKWVEEKAKANPSEVATSNELAPWILDSSLWPVIESIRGKGITAETVEAAFGWLRPRLPDQASKTFEYARAVLTRSGPSAATDKPRIYVGTIHSFKGAEADDVYLFTELPPKARESFRNADVVGMNSVARTFYVGLTRARESVTVCGTSSAADRSVHALGKWIESAASAAGVL